jgi:URI fold toxin 2
MEIPTKIKIHITFTKIDDLQEDEVFKYGISADPIDEDGLSDRLRNQVNLFNLVANAIRFVGKILISNIPGRMKADQIEQEHIDKFIEKHERRPRGNPPRRK